MNTILIVLLTIMVTSFVLAFWTTVICYPNDPGPSLPCWIVFVISTLLLLGAMIGAQ